MRALVFGTGSIGRRHITNLQTLVNAPQFIFMRRFARRDEFSDALNALVVSDLDAALASEPDLAIIATPSVEHLEPLLKLLRAGVPVYVEKPIVATRHQLDTLTTAIASLPSVPPTIVGCNLRFLPSLQILRSMLAEGAVGKIARAQLQAGSWLPDWRSGSDYRRGYSAQSAMGGGVVLDLIHELDMARFLFGEFTRVQAAGGHYSTLDIDAEDAAAVLLSRASGPVVSVGLDYVARRPLRRYEVIGDKGTLEWDLFRQRLILYRAEAAEEVFCPRNSFNIGETYCAAMRQLLNAIADGIPTVENLWEGLPSMSLALDANEAIRA